MENVQGAPACLPGPQLQLPATGLLLAPTPMPPSLALCGVLAVMPRAAGPATLSISVGIPGLHGHRGTWPPVPLFFFLTVYWVLSGLLEPSIIVLGHRHCCPRYKEAEAPGHQKANLLRSQSWWKAVRGPRLTCVFCSLMRGGGCGDVAGGRVTFLREYRAHLCCLPPGGIKGRCLRDPQSAGLPGAGERAGPALLQTALQVAGAEPQP